MKNFDVQLNIFIKITYSDIFCIHKKGTSLKTAVSKRFRFKSSSLVVNKLKTCILIYRLMRVNKIIKAVPSSEETVACEPAVQSTIRLALIKSLPR